MIVGAVVLAGIFYILLDTHADIHEWTEMVEETFHR